MNLRKWNSIALAAVAAVFVAACNESSTSPVTSPEARADLQVIAAKVKYLSTPDAGENMDLGFGGGKKGAGKTASGLALECDQDPVWYDSGADEFANGPLYYWDTTSFFTASNTPVCDIDDEIAYDISNGFNKNAIYESWFSTRTDYATGATGQVKMTGHGWVHYYSGYDLTVESIDIRFNLVNGFTSFSMNLALEKGYAVVLKLAPGVDMMSDEELPPTTVVGVGPITKAGTIVGYFELLENDTVVIRDADKVVIEVHN